MATDDGKRPVLLLGVRLADVRYVKLVSSGSGWEPVLDGIRFEEQGRVLAWEHSDGRPHRALTDQLVAIALSHPDQPDAR